MKTQDTILKALNVASKKDLVGDVTNALQGNTNVTIYRKKDIHQIKTSISFYRTNGVYKWDVIGDMYIDRTSDGSYWGEIGKDISFANGLESALEYAQSDEVKLKPLITKNIKGVYEISQN